MYDDTLTRILNLQHEIVEWTDKTFTGQTIQGKVSHLLKELNEAFEEATTDEGRVEIGDAGMLALQVAHMVDAIVPPLRNDFIDVMHAKLARNKARTWGPPAADGAFHHVKENAPKCDKSNAPDGKPRIVGNT